MKVHNNPAMNLFRNPANQAKTMPSNTAATENRPGSSSSSKMSFEQTILTQQALNDLPYQPASHAEFEKELHDFRRVVRDQMRQVGIDTSTPIQLAGDKEGRIVVQGNHPQKAEIEAFFKDRPSLSGQFRKISANTSLSNAIKQHVAFSKAYAQNPERAVSQFRHLFGADAPEPKISI